MSENKPDTTRAATDVPEFMATELAQLVRGALPEAATLVGAYAAKT